jgi:hypothetical protein
VGGGEVGVGVGGAMFGETSSGGFVVGGLVPHAKNATGGGLGRRDLEDELRRRRLDMSRLVDENERLRSESRRIQIEMSREVHRAREAEDAVAMHVIARDSFLSDIARLTGENVELRNMSDERGAVDDAVISELEACRAEARRLREMRDERADDVRRRGMEYAEMRREVTDARAKCDGMVAELDSLRTENAELRNRLDRTMDELRIKTSDLVDAEGRMDDVHDRLVSVRNSLASAEEDRRRLREELRISQHNSTVASEQLMGLREQFSRLRTEGEVDDRDSHRTSGMGRNNRQYDGGGGLASNALEDAATRPLSYEDMTAGLTRSNRVGGEYSSAWDGSRTSVPRIVDDDLSARVDELSAWLDRPRSGREGASDLTSMKRGAFVGATKRGAFDDAIEIRFDGEGEGISPGSYSVASRHVGSNRSANIGPLSTKKIFDGSNPINGPPLTGPVPDGMGTSITNDNTGTSIPSQPRHLDSKEENEHPNLMDYFYSQIRLTE